MNYLPPPQPILNKDIRISGNVEIHPTASLAPGVILQAAPNSRIVIGADVCIGMGAIISAFKGIIEIEAGAILGSGVLIIGESKIGNNCCIGTSTTIFRENISSMAVIEPGSIVGDASRQVEIKQEPVDSNQNRKSPAKSANSNLNGSGASKNGRAKPQPTVAQNDVRGSTSVSHEETSVAPTKKSKAPVVGQVYLNELLITLFPHRKDLDSHPNKSIE